MLVKCLSVKQPWLDLILGIKQTHLKEYQSIKNIENRKWSTKYRGRLLLHSSKTIDKEALNLFFPNLNKKDFKLGYILGEVELVDIVTDSNSIWAEPNQKHWVLKNPIIFDNPISYKGSLNLFNVNEELLK